MSPFYPTLVYVHLLLFVFWLGADLGVFLCGQAFRRRVTPLPERLALLKMLVTIDMGPRTAWALMVPSSLTLLRVGGWWAVPGWLWAGSFVVAAGWLWLVWDSHAHPQTARAKANGRIEGPLKIALTLFYLGLGGWSLATGAPLAPMWLGLKALLFGGIFAAAIMIDVAFKPVGAQLGALLAQGSSDATEVPLRATMDGTRRWVLAMYLLLVAISYLGATKPF